MSNPLETIYYAIPDNCPDKEMVRALGVKPVFHNYYAYLEAGGNVSCLGIDDGVCTNCPVRKPSYTVNIPQFGKFRVAKGDLRENP
jgi:hypothetical protein